MDTVSPSDYETGDLVELADENTRASCLAVCLGHINGAFHLFTQDGKWRVATIFKSGFIVPKFATKDMLNPLVAKLPIENLSYDEMVAMARSEFAPDRAAGAQLVSKMIAFSQAAEEVTQKFGVTLDRMHKLLTQGKVGRYLTLKEMHRVLFQAKKVPANPVVLYAIHRAVQNDPLCFRIVGTIGDLKTLLFEVTPASDVALVQNLQTLVRVFTDIPRKTGKPLSSLTPDDWAASPIGSFILQARDAIEQSRKYRDFTPYGMVGPAKENRPPLAPSWKSNSDLSILHFMRLWACYDQFPLVSTYHWVGAAILRATGKYAESEYLSTTVGWTFLQEVGYISPWDTHIRHLQRLPDVEVSRLRGFEPLQLGPTGIAKHISQHDLFARGKRHDWKDMRAFAIDSKDTLDVDDAISVEPTDSPEVTWIHVHVADPASRIGPDSVLARRAEKQPLTLYLSGHQVNMWGLGSELRDLFSLAPNRPCLTFSGKVNSQGELLDYKITPAILRNFLYMTPEEANEAVGDHDANITPADSFSVGKPLAEKPAQRTMTNASDLQPEDLKSVQLLHQLGKAMEGKRLAKGAMPLFRAKPSSKAYFEDDAVSAQTPPDKSAAEGSLHCKGDPFIRISLHEVESRLVSSSMRLAGEIAAKWCGDRNIPLPYVTEPEAQKNLAVLKSYAENVYYPLLRSGKEVSREQDAAFQRLLGADQLSTRPGPHFLMGVDGYAKVTSPLRRYSDLLAHWQIESALLQEQETGTVDVAKLPFQAETLEREVFPWLRLRQGIIRALDKRRGQLGYILQALVRAWKYPDEHSTPLPETFRFTVRSRMSTLNRDIMGVLDWFNVPAKVSVNSLPGLGVPVDSLTMGDILEVRLTNVNVHLELVYVEAVGKVRIAAEVAEQPQEGSVSAPKSDASTM